MSCSDEKKLPTRAAHSHGVPADEELPDLIQLQPRAINKMQSTLADDPQAQFRIFVQGFG